MNQPTDIPMNSATDSIRAVHLDLKGLPPTGKHLVELLHLFKAARYNAVLVEWEDAFPWSFDKDLRSPTAYTREEVGQFHSEAAMLGLEIIPLIQCVGHLEMPLRLPRYAHMREVADRPDVLNVLAPGSLELILNMLDDVLAISPEGRYFHLGGDEAWTFGTHADTQAHIKAHGNDDESKAELYLQHVEPCLNRIRDAGLRPLLWHDMMIHWPDRAVSRIASQADLVCWGYNGPVDQVDGHQLRRKDLERFHRLGVRLWGATAYKGCGMGNSDYPDSDARYENALSWMRLDKQYAFDGLIATGWSRHSAGSVQTDPIDAALYEVVKVGLILDHDEDISSSHGEVDSILVSEGFYERWREARRALEALSIARSAAWGTIAYIQEQHALENSIEPARANGWSDWMLGSQLEKQLGDLDLAGDMVRRVLSGLTPDKWIEEYLSERMIPLRKMFASIPTTASADTPKLPSV